MRRLERERAQRLCALLTALALGGCASRGVSRVEPVRAESAQAHAEPDLVPGSPISHRVQPGQTLYRIARTYEISVEALAEANGIRDPTSIAVGTLLVIPGASASREIAPPGAQEAGPASATAPAPVSTCSAPTASATTPTEVKSGPRRPARGPVSVSSGSGELSWPLRGVLYGRFGNRGGDRHDGIDLAAPLGTPVRTAREGRVLYAGEQKGYGLIAIVEHGGGLVTLYAHNRDLRVKTGQKVRPEQVVSTVGESGRTSGPHLHFEVRKDGVPVDPLEFLGPPPDRRPLGRRGADSR